MKIMVAGVLTREPVKVPEGEVPAVEGLRVALEAPATSHAHAYLEAPNGERIEIPESVYKALRQAVHLMARGDAVAIVPCNRQATTQQAADYLNVSRPFLIKLLNEGAIPYSSVGKHRRILFNDLMRYRAHRDADRRNRLARISKIGRELGMYNDR